MRCLRQVSRELHFPVEQASPEQFIPLPKGFEDRRQFVGRFGALDIFHFDLYRKSHANRANFTFTQIGRNTETIRAGDPLGAYLCLLLVGS